MPTFFRRLSLMALRVLALLAGAVLAISLFVAGLLAMLGLVAWSRLRGRQPAGVRWRAFRGVRSRPAHPDTQVVDVVAREVRGPEHRLMRD